MKTIRPKAVNDATGIYLACLKRPVIGVCCYCPVGFLDVRREAEEGRRSRGQVPEDPADVRCQRERDPVADPDVPVHIDPVGPVVDHSDLRGAVVSRAFS